MKTGASVPSLLYFFLLLATATAAAALPSAPTAAARQQQQHASCLCSLALVSNSSRTRLLSRLLRNSRRGKEKEEEGEGEQTPRRASQLSASRVQRLRAAFPGEHLFHRETSTCKEKQTNTQQARLSLPESTRGSRERTPSSDRLFFSRLSSSHALERQGITIAL